jgi:iron complex outermembrane recepter protein
MINYRYFRMLVLMMLTGVLFSMPHLATAMAASGYSVLNNGADDTFVADTIGVYDRSGITLTDGLDADTLFIDLPEIRVTAFNKTRRLLDTPGSISMIGAAAIERQQAPGILPLLNQMSGVFSHSGTLNTSRITVRGIGARVPYATGKIRAYFNNIPLTNGSGITIVEHIDPGVIDRIELTKGPASSAYGAGLGGTISITARNPSLRNAGISAHMEGGSFGMLRRGVTVDAGTGSFHSSLAYNRMTSDGYRDNNTFQRDVLTAVMQWEPGDRTLLTGLFAYSSTHGGIPSSIDSMLFVTSPRSAAANWKKTGGYEDVGIFLAGVSANHRLSQRLSLDVSLFSTSHNENEMRPFDVLYEDRFSGGSRAKLNYSFVKEQTLIDLMAGGELFLEDFGYANFENPGGQGVQGNLISDNKELIRYVNAFLQADIAHRMLNVSMGLNLNKTGVSYTDLYKTDGIDRSALYDPGLIVSPRISGNLRYHQYHALFFSVSHGFSPASLSETLTPDGFINMEIRPETSWSFEAGTRGSVYKNRLFYDFNLYQMYVRDLLVAERIGADAWVGRNAGASTHRGAEMEWQFYLVRRQKTDPNASLSTPSSPHNHALAPWWRPLEVSVRQALSVNHFVFTDFSDYGIQLSGNSIPGIPDMISSSAVYASFRAGFYAEFMHRYVGQMPMNDLNTRFASPYHLFDMMLGLNTSFWRVGIDVFLKINNVLDQHHASMILVNAPSFGGASPRYYYPGMPRHFSTGLRFSFPDR